MHKYRTHSCGELGIENIGDTVRISGWVQTIRDHGGVIFIDLRDQYGITQVVISEDINLMDIITKLNKESTISVSGVVCNRPANTVNKNMLTGSIEIEAKEIRILGEVLKPLPFEITSSTESREDLRLKYRFLDLRNERLQKNIILRTNIIRSIRRKLESLGFLEIQTPILTSSSPEGARDYIVPSRIHPGKFYALPQAPQQYKQLLMVSGFDKYFQIAPCFRDEDARSDRAPGEFYQLDMEMAFATQEDVFSVVEKVLCDVFAEFSTWKVSKPFERIPYKDAMLLYGSDKPDLRNPLKITDVTDIFSNIGFEAFKDKVIRAIAVPNCGEQSRSFFDKMVHFAKENGANGLSWVKVNTDYSLTGTISKFISEDAKNNIIQLTKSIPGYALFFIADKAECINKLAGSLRLELGKRLDLCEKNVYKFCWIVDFPMFELDLEKQKVDFSHNPFSMPQGGLDALNNMNPLDILAYQYDIICNGVELSSGAVRNHNIDIMLKAFEIAGYSADVVKSRFNALFDAFHYGPPPHAGIAPGVDRLVMLIANEPNIREVIAFPKNSNAQDVLMGAPSEVTEIQLNETHIKLNIKK